MNAAPHPKKDPEIFSNFLINFIVQGATYREMCLVTVTVTVKCV